MTEPVYEYVKGKGWITQQYPVVTMRCGTIVRLEPRMPGVGEAWMRVINPSIWAPNGVPDLERFAAAVNDGYANYAELYDYRQTTAFDVEQRNNFQINNPNYRVWVTVVRLDNGEVYR